MHQKPAAIPEALLLTTPLAYPVFMSDTKQTSTILDELRDQVQKEAPKELRECLIMLIDSVKDAELGKKSRNEALGGLVKVAELLLPNGRLRSSFAAWADEARHPVVKYNLVDSVFMDYFGREPYRRDLCSFLLNDSSIRDEDIRQCTLENVLVNGMYNDFGAVVRGTAVILTEEQTEWSINIVLRLFFYLADTWRVLVEDEDLHGTCLVSVPFPRLFVVCPRAPKHLGNTIELGKTLFPGVKQKCPRLYVTIIREAPKSTALGQYLRFMKIWAREIKALGRTRRAIDATIKRCRTENIMVDYLDHREKELVNIMTNTMRQEKAIAAAIQAVRREEAAKAAKAAKAEAAKAAERTAQGLVELGETAEAEESVVLAQLMKVLNVSEDKALSLFRKYSTSKRN